MKADSIRRRQAIEWMLENPVRWGQLAFKKTVYVWGTSSSIMSFVSADRMPARYESVMKAAINIWWTALFVWVSVATVRTSIWANNDLLLPLLLLGYVFGIHLFFEALSRHHIPVLWVLILIAATGLGRGQVVAGHQRQVSPAPA